MTEDITISPKAWKDANVAIYGYGRMGKAIAEYFDHPFFISRNTPDKHGILRQSDWTIVSLDNGADYTGCVSSLEMRFRHLPGNLEGIGEVIRNAAGTKTRLIVVTNPVDVFELAMAGALPDHEVQAFGDDLDDLRYSEFLGKPVNSCGFHGLKVPLLGLESKGEYLRIMSEVDKRAMSDYLRSGIDYGMAGKAFSGFFERQYDGKRKEAMTEMNQIERDLLFRSLGIFNSELRKYSL